MKIPSSGSDIPIFVVGHHVGGCEELYDLGVKGIFDSLPALEVGWS